MSEPTLGRLSIYDVELGIVVYSLGMKNMAAVWGDVVRDVRGAIGRKDRSGIRWQESNKNGNGGQLVVKVSWMSVCDSWRLLLMCCFATLDVRLCSLCCGTMFPFTVSLAAVEDIRSTCQRIPLGLGET